MTPAHPILWLAVLWPVAVIVLMFVARGQARLRPALAASLVSLAAAVLFAFGAIVVWYATVPSYFDKAEPTITAVAAAFLAGHPLYPALDAPERYAHVYGPVLFFAHAIALRVFGLTIQASKVVGASAILVSLALGLRLFARRVGLARAVVASAACVAVYMDFGDVSFWTRADPLLVLCAVVAWWAADEAPTSVAVVMLALVTGLSADLKLTGPAYLLPALALFSRRTGWRPAATAVLVAAPIAAAPFLLHAVSAQHYWQYLRLSARSGLEGSIFRHNVEWAVFMALPVAALVVGGREWRSGAADPVVLAATAIGMAAIAIVAAKPGAGPYHLLPFLPGLAWLTLTALSRAPMNAWRGSAIAAVIATAVALAVPRQWLVVQTILRRDRTPAADDLRAFAAAHPQRTIAVGYSGKSFLPDARPVIVFATGDYWIDEPAVQEERLAGRDLPAATLQMIATCRIDYWLLPAGQPPFAVLDEYWPRGPRDVFPVSFEQTFAAAYRKDSQTAFFDVWVCRHETPREDGNNVEPPVRGFGIRGAG